MFITGSLKNQQVLRVGSLLKGYASEDGEFVFQMAMSLVGSLFFLASGGLWRRGTLKESEKGRVPGMSVVELKHVEKMRPKVLVVLAKAGHKLL